MPVDLFNDLAFRDAMKLSGVNSIDWARILAQIVYYFTSAVALGAPQSRVSFAVPTGNFGDVASFTRQASGSRIDGWRWRQRKRRFSPGIAKQHL